MVGSETTGENSESKFEMRDTIASHASDGFIQLFGRDEGGVVSQERVIFCDSFNVAKASVSTTYKIRETASQIVL